MFLTCSICKHSTEYPVSEGAPEEDLFKCRKTIPSPPNPDKNQTANFPIVEAGWECDNYQKKMGT